MNLQGLVPDRKVTAAAFTRNLLKGIKEQEAEASKSRERNIPWTFRAPNGVLVNLKKAADKHNTTMTKIVLAALDEVLPALLSDEPPAASQSAELQHFTEMLRQALPQLVGAGAETGPRS